LAAAGESVVDVPPKLSARVRVLSTGNARNNDGLDALATSRHERLVAVDPEAESEVLRLLSERREDLVAERTRAFNRLHRLLRDLVPGGVAGTLSAHRGARILHGLRPQGSSSRVCRRLASEVLRDIRTLDRKIADLNERIESEVEASGTTLTEIFGIGPILAARIIGTVGDVARFPTKAHFASYSGTRRWRPRERGGSAPQALAGRQPQAQLRPSHGRGMPGQVGRLGRRILPQEDRGRQVP